MGVLQLEEAGLEGSLSGLSVRGVSEKEQKYHLMAVTRESEDSIFVGLFPFAAWKCWWGRVERSPVPTQVVSFTWLLGVIKRSFPFQHVERHFIFIISR